MNQMNESVNEPVYLLHYTEDKNFRDMISFTLSVTVSVIDFGQLSSFS